MHHEKFSKHFLLLFSVRPLHDKLLLIMIKLQKKFRLNPHKCQKVVF